MEGEREGDFRKKREKLYQAPREDLEKEEIRGEEHHTWQIPEFKSAEEISE